MKGGGEKILVVDDEPLQRVIASGFSESEDVKIALQLGARGFIKKPYSIEQLGRALKQGLG